MFVNYQVFEIVVMGVCVIGAFCLVGNIVHHYKKLSRLNLEIMEIQQALQQLTLERAAQQARQALEIEKVVIQQRPLMLKALVNELAVAA